MDGVQLGAHEMRDFLTVSARKENQNDIYSLWYSRASGLDHVDKLVVK